LGTLIEGVLVELWGVLMAEDFGGSLEMLAGRAFAEF